MTDTVAVQRIKEQQTRHWNAVAGGWAAWLAWTERSFLSVTECVADRAGWAPGVRVLDLACGAGYPALAAAVRVSPGGKVIASDLAPEMTEVAAAAAAAAGITNIEFRTMDAEQLEIEDASVDSVTNVYGLMFCPDPLRAVREAHRVLRPGGRIAIVTWDERSKSSFFSVITPVAAKHLSLAEPAPGVPGPFRFSSPAELDSMMRTVGFEDVRVESRSMPLELDSADQYCQMFGDVAWKSRIDALDAARLRAFRDDVRRAVDPFVENGRVRLTAASLCTSGRKAW